MLIWKGKGDVVDWLGFVLLYLDIEVKGII